MKPNVHQIYFALDRATGRVKIGRTRQHLATRMASLSLEYCLEDGLKLMYSIATFDRCAEQAIHQLLREYRIAGEWFTNGDHIQIAIELWLRYQAGVEHLRIVHRSVLNRVTGKKVIHYVPAARKPEEEDEYVLAGQRPKRSVMPVCIE